MDQPDDLPVRAGYAAWASCYDDDGNPLTAIEGPALAAWFGPLEGRFALDLGSGTGRHALAMAGAGARVWALDDSPEMLALALAKFRGLPIACARHRMPAPLPFADSTFDLVALGLVAEHVDDLGSTLLEAARVARSGGRLVLSTLHPDRTLGGQRARFIDPATGERRHVATIHRTVAEYLAVAEGAGWALVEERPLVVPAALAERLPRALPYVGRALGWAACWARPA